MGATLPLIGTDIFEPEHGERFTPECDEFRLKEAMKKLRLKMKKNFMPYLDYYNVVEIYALDGRQLYSNGRFFEVTSIPPEEIPKKPFDEHFIRPVDIQMALQQDIVRSLSNVDGRSPRSESSFAHAAGIRRPGSRDQSRLPVLHDVVRRRHQPSCRRARHARRGSRKFADAPLDELAA